jgi:hypothetical protein
MTGFLGGSLIGVGQGGAIDTGDIQKSLRFRGAQDISDTPSAGSTLKAITFSFWLQRCALGTEQAIFGGQRTGTGYAGDYFGFDPSDRFFIGFDDSANPFGPYATTAVFRDPSAFQHFVLRFDTAQAVQADRVRLYVNNQSISISNGLALNADLYFLHNNGNPNWWGVRSDGAGGKTSYFSGYLARCCAVAGQSLAPSSFGYQNTEINEWVTKTAAEVKAVVDTGNASSSMLEFDDGTSLATLGNDYSSKNNDWVLNGHSLTAGANYDWMDDVPGNSFATWNTLDKGTSLVIAEGGTLVGISGSANQTVRTTISLPSSGDFYAEVVAGTNTILVGVAKSEATLLNWLGSDANGWSYNSNNGQKYNNGSGSAYGATYTAGDVIGIKFSSGAGLVEFLKNNVSQGVAFTGLSGQLFISVGCVSNMGSTYINFGQRPFAYTPPTGFKALSQRNLPDVPAALLDPTDHHIDITVTKSGDTNFTLPWNASTYDTFFEIKRRDAAGDWYQIDGLRGYDKILKSNGTAAETTDANVLGVSGTTCTLKSTLANGTYVISATKAGLSASRQTNTDGSITSTVSRNVDSGFAIVKWNQPASSPVTVGHGLGKPLGLNIIRWLDAADNWYVFHSARGGTKNLRLNNADAEYTASSIWNDSAPSSTVFTLGSGFNSAHPMVAYCYADSAIQKSFSYTGNGSAGGPYVNLGFECGRIIFKPSSAVGAWELFDSARDVYNVANRLVEPNSSGAEQQAASYEVDLLASAVKLRGSGASINASTVTYIGHAWAVTTGKYSNAK